MTFIGGSSQLDLLLLSFDSVTCVRRKIFFVSSEKILIVRPVDVNSDGPRTMYERPNRLEGGREGRTDRKVERMGHLEDFS